MHVPRNPSTQQAVANCSNDKCCSVCEIILPPSLFSNILNEGNVAGNTRNPAREIQEKRAARKLYPIGASIAYTHIFEYVESLKWISELGEYFADKILVIRPAIAVFRE